MKKIIDSIIRVFMRIVYGYTMRNVHSLSEMRLQPNTNGLINLQEIKAPRAAKYVIFLPRREASGLLFHTGVGVDKMKYSMVKVANTSTKVVRVPEDTHIGFLFYIY